jgi:hypothetical protein
VLNPTGEEVPVLDAVYALQFRGFIGVDGNGLLPDLPAPVFSSLDGCMISGFMSWMRPTLAVPGVSCPLLPEPAMVSFCQ